MTSSCAKMPEATSKLWEITHASGIHTASLAGEKTIQVNEIVLNKHIWSAAGWIPVGMIMEVADRSFKGGMFNACGYECINDDNPIWLAWVLWHATMNIFNCQHLWLGLGRYLSTCRKHKVEIEWLPPNTKEHKEWAQRCVNASFC